MTDKTIIEKEVKKVLKRNGCIVDDGYSNYEERLINEIIAVILTQRTLAEFRGEEKARKEIEKTIRNINIKDHFCRFNDGEQNCECYLKAIEDLKQSQERGRNENKIVV